MEYVGQYNRDGKLYILKICFRVIFKQILHNLRKTLGNLSSSWLVCYFTLISYSITSFRKSFGGPGKGNTSSILSSGGSTVKTNDNLRKNIKRIIIIFLQFITCLCRFDITINLFYLQTSR